MKLILKQDVENLGEAGDVVQVKPGFGRNYLLPQGLAYIASDANMKRLEEEQTAKEERRRRDFLEARRRAAQLEDVSLAFRERAGEDGKLFGSVSAADVAASINESEIDFELDKKSVMLDEPIKALGATQVMIQLHKDVIVPIDVLVEPEEG